METRIDPNAWSVLAARCDVIRHATGPLVQDRCRFFTERVKDQDLLDIGCVNHSADTSTQQDWLHAHLARHARSCLGVDILERDIDALAAKGFCVKVWDVTSHPLPQTFDVIVCGELIEHLGNPGGLFANCRGMLRQGGCLYVSTPNPWFINYILKAVFWRSPIVENADHVAWYEPWVMAELAVRNGFQLRRYYGIQVTQTNTWKAKMFFKLMPLALALGFRKELFAKSIIYELALDDEGRTDAVNVAVSSGQENALLSQAENRT